MSYDDWKTESPEDERIRLGNGEDVPEDDVVSHVLKHGVGNCVDCNAGATAIYEI